MTKQWSLTDCIGYALANNIDVQQRALQVEQNEVELSTAKYSRLPDLNASIGGDASFGRVLSSDNTYKDNNQTSGSLNISTSLPVFQGMRINRQVKGGKLDLAAAMQDLERAREDVSINVMTLYLEVLYNKELADVAERQLALSTLQATQSRELVAAGIPEGALSIAIGRTPRREVHAVLLIATPTGEFVLDNRSAWVSRWYDLNYRWDRRQVPGSQRWARVSS